MIDTDKYEGHLIDKAVEDKSQVWAWNEWMLKNSKTVDVKNITATIELLNDAPLLLAEVKRLRHELLLILSDFQTKKTDIYEMRNRIETILKGDD